MTQLVVLCGGLGTRMAPVTHGQKCLVPVAGRPFLAHVLRLAADGPVDRVLLLAGHRAPDVRAFADAYATAPFAVTVHTQDRLDGPVAALRDAYDALAPEFALVLGDVLPPRRRDLWKELAETADRTGSAAVMATARAADSADPGNVVAAGERVVRYDKHRPGPLIDRGCRYLRRSSLDDHPGDTDQEFFGGMAARGALAHRLVDEPVIEVGTPDRWTGADTALRRTGAPA